MIGGSPFPSYVSARRAEARKAERKWEAAMAGFQRIGTIARSISQETAERLIAEAEASGDTDRAEALRRIWQEHEARHG